MDPKTGKSVFTTDFTTFLFPTEVNKLAAKRVKTRKVCGVDPLACSRKLTSFMETCLMSLLIWNLEIITCTCTCTLHCTVCTYRLHILENLAFHSLPLKGCVICFKQSFRYRHWPIGTASDDVYVSQIYPKTSDSCFLAKRALFLLWTTLHKRKKNVQATHCCRTFPEEQNFSPYLWWRLRTLCACCQQYFGIVFSWRANPAEIYLCLLHLTWPMDSLT